MRRRAQGTQVEQAVAEQEFAFHMSNLSLDRIQMKRTKRILMGKAISRAFDIFSAIHQSKENPWTHKSSSHS